MGFHGRKKRRGKISTGVASASLCRRWRRRCISLESTDCSCCLVRTLYSTDPMPPIPKQKIRLSTSKPVVWARLNKLGGFQYWGTNNGSVRPKGVVNTLVRNIWRRYSGNSQYSASHGIRKAPDQINQT